MFPISRMVLIPLLLAAVAARADSAESMNPATHILPTAETEPSAFDDSTDAAFWLHPGDLSRSLIVVAAGSGGLELHALDGRRIASYREAEIDHVDVSYGFDMGGESLGLLVGYDRVSGGLLAFTIDPETQRVAVRSRVPLAVGAEVTGLCTYRSKLTGAHYVFAATGDGAVQQWQLYARDGKVEGRLARTIAVGMGTGYCAVDAVAGNLYVAEETVGIWKLAAEPETDPVRVAVDLAQPRGHLAGEVKGLAIQQFADDTGYLLASDVEAGAFNVYRLEDAGFVGSFNLGAGSGIDAVEDAEGIALTSALLGTQFPGGVFAVVDEDNDGKPGNLKLAPWANITGSLGLSDGLPRDPRHPSAAAGWIVAPTIETDPDRGHGDAADDIAIWVHPSDPALSLVIGADKKRGLVSYDMQGRRIQTLPDGRMNNVDLRDGFSLGGNPTTIVASSDRTAKTLALYAIDPVTRRLRNVSARRIPLELADPYGLCMYRSARTGDFYVFVNSSGDAQPYTQWRLFERDGKVDAERVRSFTLETQAEGCVADDAQGNLYVAEEDFGIWRYDAEPDGGSDRVLVDRVGDGRLVADVEGVTLFRGAGDAGYVIVSNQGADSYAVYRRESGNAFVGLFHVAANDALGIDGASETDGLDVTSAALGPAFPRGMLVVQDGRNISPPQPQNFKFVSWEAIAALLERESGGD